MTDLPSSCAHIAYDSVDSTNKVALEAAFKGEAGPLWITAKEQREGRGRRGRPWVSDEGNLFASLLLSNPAPQKHVAEMPLVIATAAHRAICDCLTPEIRSQISIKWPNDILWNRRKICGILLENSLMPDRRQVVVIGIGVNCGHHPDTTDGLDAAHLSQSGFDIAPLELFSRLAFHVADRLQVWNGGAGLGAIRQDWLQRADGVGQKIVVRLPNEELCGTFEKLDEQGGLILLGDDGTRKTIYAGDVFWPQSDKDK